MVVQVPDARRHLIHHYGWYSNASRAKRARQGSDVAKKTAPGSGLPRGVTPVPATTDADAKAARRRWASLIRHVYEVDPLICPRCQLPMKIIPFLTDHAAIRAILAAVHRAPSPAPPPPSRPPRARPGG